MSDTQTVIDMMTAGIVNRKAEKATKLTPVGSEKGGPLDGSHPELDFPHDNPQTTKQAIRDGLKAVAAIHDEVKHIHDNLLALAGLYGMSLDEATGAAKLPPRAQAEVERQAHAEVERQSELFVAERQAAREAEFRQDFEEKSRRAQAAAFGMLEAAAMAEYQNVVQTLLDGEGKRPEPVEPTCEGSAGWVCPEHGADALVTQTSRKGRTYRSCQASGCREFERA